MLIIPYWGRRGYQESNISLSLLWFESGHGLAGAIASSNHDYTNGPNSPAEKETATCLLKHTSRDFRR